MLRFLKPKPEPSSDASLLARFQEDGDLEALANLYSRYTELVYGLCLKYLSDEVKAEDAVMTIFESLITKAAQHEIGHFRNWLYTFVRNHCLMQSRKEKRQLAAKKEADFVYSDQFLHPVDTSVPDENNLDQDLNQCLDQLKEKQKACVEAFYLQELSYKEIAESRNESLGQVRSYIQNGRRNLRLCMEEKMKARKLE